MMAHGSMDPMIPMTKTLRTRQALTRFGYSVVRDDYNMNKNIRNIRRSVKVKIATSQYPSSQHTANCTQNLEVSPGSVTIAPQFQKFLVDGWKIAVKRHQ
jgi:hypothetical protein